MLAQGFLTANQNPLASSRHMFSPSLCFCRNQRDNSNAAENGRNTWRGIPPETPRALFLVLYNRTSQRILSAALYPHSQGKGIYGVLVNADSSLIFLRWHLSTVAPLRALGLIPTPLFIKCSFLGSLTVH
jgi:hypothetical protein